MCNGYRLLHERIGNFSRGKFLEIRANGMFSETHFIEAVKPRRTRLSFDKVEETFVHSTFNVCGPMTPSTIDGRNYYVIFVDQFTHYCVTYLIT